MIPLLGIGHGTAAQHGSPQEGPHTAGAVQIDLGRGRTQSSLAVFPYGHHTQRGQKGRSLGRTQRQYAFPGAAEMGRGHVVNLRRKLQALLQQGIDPAGYRHAFAGKLDAQFAPAQQVQAAQRHIQR